MSKTVKRDQIKKKLGTRGNKPIWVPARCLADLRACLDHLRVGAKDMDISPGTLKKWEYPDPAGEMVEIRSLLTAMFVTCIHPEKWGLSESDARHLGELWDDFVADHKIEKFDTNHDLVLEFRDHTSDRWKRIQERAQEYLKEGQNRHRKDDDNLHPPSRYAGEKPLWEAILGQVTTGSLRPGSTIGIKKLRDDLESSSGRNVKTSDVCSALQELVKRGDVVRKSQVIYQVKELSKCEWDQIVDFRMYLEPLNIKYLFQEDGEVIQAVMQNLSAWMDVMKQAMDEGDVAEFFFADIKFHCSLAGSSDFRHALVRTPLPFLRRAGARLRRAEILMQIYQDHKKIFDILWPMAQENTMDETRREQILKDAMAAMTEHLQHARDLFEKE